MTSVSDDLARVREALLDLAAGYPHVDSAEHAEDCAGCNVNAATLALARVETELARLRAVERDASIKDRALTDYFADASRRADDANAEVARLQTDLQRMEREVGLWMRSTDEARAEVARLTEMCALHTQNELELVHQVARLRDGLRRIAEWDCLNPPDPELCHDHPWLKRHVDALLSAQPNQQEQVGVCREPGEPA